MSMRLLVTMALAALVIGSAAITSAQAAPAVSTTIQSAAQSLDFTEQARRICHKRLRCSGFLRCRWEDSCYVTKDYPPEHRRR